MLGSQLKVQGFGATLLQSTGLKVPEHKQGTRSTLELLQGFWTELRALLVFSANSSSLIYSKPLINFVQSLGATRLEG